MPITLILTCSRAPTDGFSFIDSQNICTRKSTCLPLVPSFQKNQTQGPIELKRLRDLDAKTPYRKRQDNLALLRCTQERFHLNYERLSYFCTSGTHKPQLALKSNAPGSQNPRAFSLVFVRPAGFPSLRSGQAHEELLHDQTRNQVHVPKNKRA